MPPREGWERTIGSHTVQFEPPDILILRITGDIEEAHVRPLREELARLSTELPHVYGLADLSQMGTVTAAARRIAAGTKNPANTSNAIFGARFVQRVLVQLVVKAAGVFSGATPRFGMFETEAEARAWIDEQRRARSKRT